jgi:hypothetical protein
MSEPNRIKGFRHFGDVSNIRKSDKTIGLSVPITFPCYKDILQNTANFETLPKVKNRQLSRKIRKIKGNILFKGRTRIADSSMHTFLEPMARMNNRFIILPKITRPARIPISPFLLLRSSSCPIQAWSMLPAARTMKNPGPIMRNLTVVP